MPNLVKELEVEVDILGGKSPMHPALKNTPQDMVNFDKYK